MQQRQRIILRGGKVYDHDGDIHAPATADVLIEDGRIREIRPQGSSSIPESYDREIDVRGKLLLPGFFNAHYHSHDTLLKGSFETIGLDYWAIYAMPPAYQRRRKEELRLRTLVGAIECIRSGITTVQDMNFLIPFDDEDADVILSAYEEAGVRCVFAPQFSNEPRTRARVFYDELLPAEQQWRLSAGLKQFPDGNAVSMLEKYISSRQGRFPLVEFALGPSSPESCSEELWIQLTEVARRLSIPVYTHIYENKGMTHIARTRFASNAGSLVHWLHQLGALGSWLTLAHSVWLRQDEIDLIAETGAHVAVNPVGNLKTRSGIAPIRALLRAGINVGLGCDNCSCSDAQNMFQAMKLFVTLPAVADGEEGYPAAADALRAATTGGALTAGQRELGHLRAGMKADLMVIDLNDISYVPLNSAARQLVYTEGGRAVQTVIIDGRIVMEDGRICTVDESALREQVAAIIPGVRRELAEVQKRVAPVLPLLREAEARTLATDIGVNRLLDDR